MTSYVCHMHTYDHRKIPKHINSRTPTRNTTNSPDKIAFSGSLRRQRVGCFAHCEGHIGWWFLFSMHVCAGDSDQMLYQHIPVLTPDITGSYSSVPPSFLTIVVMLVLFRCFLMWFGASKSSLLPTFQKLDVCFRRKRDRTIDFSTLTLRKLKSLSPENLKICISNTVHSEK